jgi:hypothetical protein
VFPASPPSGDPIRRERKKGVNHLKKTYARQRLKSFEVFAWRTRRQAIADAAWVLWGLFMLVLLFISIRR